MKFVKHILICLLTVVLFYISWPPQSMSGLIFIAFLPVLYLIFNYNPEARKYPNVYLYSILFTTFFCINFSLSSWLMNAHWFGGIFASIFNATLMSLVVFLIYKIRCNLGDKQAYFAFPTLWLAFEYLHLNWDLTWPWMSLGNVFAEQTNWIQWYEFTGVLGGSLWILIVNTLLFFSLSQLTKKKAFSTPSIFSLFFLISPIIVSNKALLNSNYLAGEEVKVVIVQPNYEPHEEKFKIPQYKQLQEVEAFFLVS